VPENFQTVSLSTPVNKGCGPTTSSRHFRPFTGKQRASSDSSGDGTTPNVALNYP